MVTFRQQGATGTTTANDLCHMAHVGAAMVNVISCVMLLPVHYADLKVMNYEYVRLRKMLGDTMLMRVWGS